jgi:hypothetical protein
MQKKNDLSSEVQLGISVLALREVLSNDWRVLMTKHPQTGVYYAAGIKLVR